MVELPNVGGNLYGNSITSAQANQKSCVQHHLIIICGNSTVLTTLWVEVQCQGEEKERATSRRESFTRRLAALRSKNLRRGRPGCNFGVSRGSPLGLGSSPVGRLPSMLCATTRVPTEGRPVLGCVVSDLRNFFHSSACDSARG